MQADLSLRNEIFMCKGDTLALHCPLEAVVSIPPDLRDSLQFMSMCDHDDYREIHIRALRNCFFDTAVLLDAELYFERYRDGLVEFLEYRNKLSEDYDEA
jgi:hypothetical protein